MTRPPAFQFYPDKWQSHTRRLSDSAHRVFHDLICWMWEQSPDQCSIEASVEAVSCATAHPLQKVTDAFAEIMNAFAPLLRCENGRWVSNGLRKEVQKQAERRDKAKRGADARWKDANASQNNANASLEHSTPSPSPSPSLSLSVDQEPKSLPERGLGKTKSENNDLFGQAQYEPLDIAKDFSKFTKLYPRHVGLKAAQAWWRKHAASPDVVEAILQGTQVWIDSGQWNDPSYALNMDKFLKLERWKERPPQKRVQRKDVVDEFSHERDHKPFSFS